MDLNGILAKHGNQWSLTPLIPAVTSVIGVAGISGLKPNQVTFNYFGNDPVPTQSFIGGNPGFSTLRHLWTVLTGPDNTQHSCYGTGAAGCAQVEIPTVNGYQGTSDGNATLYKYVNGVLVTTPVNSK